MTSDGPLALGVNAAPYTAKRSALHSAAFHANKGVARMLVAAGAEVDFRDYAGRTPLAAALRELAF